ncbi:MAG: ABC transporter ATP-binding protein [Bacillota bacterium]
MALLEMRNISKRFSDTIVALDGVDFELQQGEIVSLLGENGAGKTTLMKVLYGMVKPNTGEILYRGAPIRIDKPSTAIKMGIYMVHQHFMLIPAMPVVENVIVGDEEGKGALLDRRGAETIVRELIKQFNFDIDPNILVERLSVGQCQRVELLKALYRKADVLILDEPTAVLTPSEVDELFVSLRKLREIGKSIVIITHKLKETLAIADRICVLRNGHMVQSNVLPANTSTEELSRLMVGRNIDLDKRRPTKNIGKVRFSASGINVDHGMGYRLENISLDVRGGEILGIAGVEGNGQSLLLKVLAGLETSPTAHITVDGKEIGGSPKCFIDAGIGHVPEDRTIMGIVEDMSIKDNIILGYHKRKMFCKHGFRDEPAINKHAKSCRKNYDIKADSIDMLTRALSGGNQQKVLIARTMSQELKALIIAQPTRGVDVGAMEYIHDQIIGLRDRGIAILLVSADLDEVCALSDRIAVIYEGKIVVECQPGELDKVQLGLLMTGNSIA